VEPRLYDETSARDVSRGPVVAQRSGRPRGCLVYPRRPGNEVRMLDTAIVPKGADSASVHSGLAVASAEHATARRGEVKRASRIGMAATYV